VTAFITVPAFRVYGWSRGRWTLRATYSSESEAVEQAEALHHRQLIRTKVEQGTRRVASYTQPHAPSEQQQFRHQQADLMFQRRLDTAYHKSGCNGTEIISFTHRP
jgi:hypothetical protein